MDLISRKLIVDTSLNLLSSSVIVLINPPSAQPHICSHMITTLYKKRQYLVIMNQTFDHIFDKPILHSDLLGID